MAARNQPKMLSVMNSIKCAGCGKAIDLMALAEHDCEANRRPPKPPVVPSKKDIILGGDPAIQQGAQRSPQKKLPLLPAPGFLRWGKSAPPPQIDPDAANRAYDIPPELSASDYSDYSRGPRTLTPITPSTQITSPGSTWSRGQPKPSRSPTPPSATMLNQPLPSPLFAPPEPLPAEKAPSKGLFDKSGLKSLYTTALGPFNRGGGTSKPLPKSPLRSMTDQVMPQPSNKPQFRNEAGQEHSRMQSLSSNTDQGTNRPSEKPRFRNEAGREHFRMQSLSSNPDDGTNQPSEKPRFRNEAGRQHFRMQSRASNADEDNNRPGPPPQQEKMSDVDRFLQDMADFQPSQPLAQRQPFNNDPIAVRPMTPPKPPIINQRPPYPSQPYDRKPFSEFPMDSELNPSPEPAPVPMRTDRVPMRQEDSWRSAATSAPAQPEPVPVQMRIEQVPMRQEEAWKAAASPAPAQWEPAPMIRANTFPAREEEPWRTTAPPTQEASRAGGFLTIDPAIQEGLEEPSHRRARSNPSQDMRGKPRLFPDSAAVPDPRDHDRNASFSTSGQSSLTSSPERRGNFIREHQRAQQSYTFPKPAMETKHVCRGCTQTITGRSLKDVSGRLSGRYHRDCFRCVACAAPFPVGEFYVLNDEPLCKRDYHERNGSLCGGCAVGIEGRFVQTDRRHIFHEACFRCSTCDAALREEYWELDGRPLCQRHAFDRDGGDGPRGGYGGGSRRNPRKRQTRHGTMNSRGMGSDGGSRLRPERDRVPPMPSRRNNVF